MENKYIVKPESKNLAKKQQPSNSGQERLLLSAKQIVKSRRLTIVISAVAWTLCGSYAYNVWSNKQRNKPSDEKNVHKEDDASTDNENGQGKSMIRDGYSGLSRWERFKKRIEPKQKYDSDIIDPRPESYAKHRISSNPNVVLNKDKERLEILSSYFGKRIASVKQVPLEEVAKDENGNLQFDEDGNPVIIRDKFRQFIHDDMQRFYKMIGFLTGSGK